MHPAIPIGQLLLHLGAIEGRKKLQKMVHILQSSGAPFQESFELSHFGAFSGELHAEVDCLVRDKLIEEKEPAKAGKGWTYRASEKMQKLFSDLSIPLQSDWLDLAVKLNKRSAQDLEGISTVIFLKDRGWKGKSLSERFRILKPRISKSFARFLKDAKTLAA